MSERSDGRGRRPPSVVPGIVVLGLAAVLIVVVLVNPGMPHWLRLTIAIVSVVMVLLLLGYAVRLFLTTTRGRR